MSMKEEMKPLAYALADAIGTDFATGAQGSNSFAGSRKAVLELFEGYSPTVISGIDNSLYDPGNKVLAVDQHIFGNVGAITIVEGQQSTAASDRTTATAHRGIASGHASDCTSGWRAAARQSTTARSSTRSGANWRTHATG